MTEPEFRDFSAEFADLVHEESTRDPSFGNTGIQLPADESIFTALLGRNEFLKDFLDLYGDEPDVPGYSHCRTLRQIEGYTEVQLPSEDVAILQSGSAVNAFIDDLLAASDHLSSPDARVEPIECSTVKLGFAAEAWARYETAAIWLTRMIDAVLQQGAEVSTMTQSDVEMELFLCTGRTVEDTDSYDALATQILECPSQRFIESLKESFPELLDHDELLHLVVEWSATEVFFAYDMRDDGSKLTPVAKEHIHRQHEAQTVLIGGWMEKIASMIGIEPENLIQRLLPFAKEIRDVALVGIFMTKRGDEDEWTPEELAICDEWFPDDESDFEN